MQTSQPTRSQPTRSLRRDLQDAPGFSTWALLLAVLGFVAGTIITSAFGTDHWGTLAGAAVGPVISTTFATKRTGERGGIRNAIVIILSVGALLITVTGFTFADHVAGSRSSPVPIRGPVPSSQLTLASRVHRRPRHRSRPRRRMDRKAKD